jgi:hypothetical protein
VFFVGRQIVPEVREIYFLAAFDERFPNAAATTPSEDSRVLESTTGGVARL